MDQAPLVGPDVPAGKRLVEVLGSDLQVEAAFWLMEDDNWRLVLSRHLFTNRDPSPCILAYLML